MKFNFLSSKIFYCFFQNGLTLHIENAGLSSKHAKFSYQDINGGGFQVSDLNSESGKKNFNLKTNFEILK